MRPTLPAVAATYDRHLTNLVLTHAHTTEPALLPLSRAANERVLDLERTLELRLAPHAELGHITDWAAKLTGATTRIAGLLHLASQPASDIQPATIDAAARLGHYSLAHALAVFDTMAAGPLVDDAAVLLDWILRTGRTRFTRRDAFTGLSRSRFRTVADLDPALDHLVDHGYIRPGPTPAPTGGRPASASFEVHPHAAKAAKAAEAPNLTFRGFSGFCGTKSVLKPAPAEHRGRPPAADLRSAGELAVRMLTSAGFWESRKKVG